MRHLGPRLLLTAWILQRREAPIVHFEPGALVYWIIFILFILGLKL